jgi:hypothetical protein
MHTKRFISLCFLLATALPSFAQITKGAKTIGNANLNFQALREEPDLGPRNYRSSVDLGFNGFSYMLTNNFQIGLNIGISTNRFAVDSLNYRTNQLNLSPNFTYYFSKNKNKFFLRLSGQYAPTSIKKSGKLRPNELDFETYNLNGYQVATGLMRPINEQIFLISALTYEKSRLYDFFKLNIGFTNFITSISANKTENDGTPYLAQGRSIISGNLNVDYYPTRTFLSTIASFSHLKFKNDHLAFGYYGIFTSSYLSNSFNFFYLNGGALARYYIPMSKKWFIYPELGLGLAASLRQFGNSNFFDQSFKLDFKKSLGVNYFLSRNIALDVNFNFDLLLERDERFAEYNFNSGLNFGVVYFIDKFSFKQFVQR